MDTSNPVAAEATLPYIEYAEPRETGGWCIDEASTDLVEVVDIVTARLTRVDARAAAMRPAPDKWSIKEIIGHLIDSAANNHQRFVRAQYGDGQPHSGYAQEFWVEVQGYVDAPWPELVEFWRLYNRHLARVMTRVPAEALDIPCRVGPYEPVPLGYLMEDYVAHLKHHVSQINELLPS